VHLLAGEAERVLAHAERLGVAEPVVDGRLRQIDGRCAFLLTDQRCAIHAAFGADAKPLVCRQFPFVRVDADGELRDGIDPASHAWATTRRDGPPLVPPAGAAPRPAPLPPDQRHAEAALLAALAAPDASLGSAVRLLCGRAPGDGVPVDVAARWHARLTAAPLGPLLDRPEVGPLHRRSLAPLLDALRASPHPPPPRLTPTDERAALDLVHETIALRLVSRCPLVALTGLTLLLGATSIAGVAPDPRAFHVGLSTWCRTIRATPFLAALFPSPDALRWIVAGGNTPPPA
jgi:hypothetical protein